MRKLEYITQDLAGAVYMWGLHELLGRPVILQQFRANQAIVRGAENVCVCVYPCSERYMHLLPISTEALLPLLPRFRDSGL